MFDEDEGGLVRERLSDYPYLLMLMNICPGDWYNQLERINMRLHEENGRAVEMVKGRDQKVWKCSGNKFWKNICCIISYPTFGLGGSRLWEKCEAQKISTNK